MLAFGQNATNNTVTLWKVNRSEKGMGGGGNEILEYVAINDVLRQQTLKCTTKSYFRKPVISKQAM